MNQLKNVRKGLLRNNNFLITLKHTTKTAEQILLCSAVFNALGLFIISTLKFQD